MKIHRCLKRSCLTILCCGMLSLIMTGCQTSIGGQTLPSAHYLRDDIQYYPAGDEFLLSRQKDAIEKYKAEKEAIRDGLLDE